MRLICAITAAVSLAAVGAMAAQAPETGLAPAPAKGGLLAETGWTAEDFGMPATLGDVSFVGGDVELVRKGRGGGKNRGGASRGANRNGNRNRNRNSNRNVNRNRDVDIDVDHNDGFDGGSALVGGMIGLGVGAAIANSNNNNHTCPDNNGDGICDNAQ